MRFRVIVAHTAEEDCRQRERHVRIAAERCRSSGQLCRELSDAAVSRRGAAGRCIPCGMVHETHRAGGMVRRAAAGNVSFEDTSSLHAAKW